MTASSKRDVTRVAFRIFDDGQSQMIHLVRETQFGAAEAAVILILHKLLNGRELILCFCRFVGVKICGCFHTFHRLAPSLS